MTVDEWLDCAALWARLWPHRPLPPESIEPWYDLLADLDGTAVRRALLTWAARPDRSWPPQSPGELRAELDDVGDWTQAWSELATLVRRHGSYAPRPDLPPDLDAYVDSLGGWTQTCRALDPTDSTQRAQFRDYYATRQQRTRHEQARAIATTLLPELTAGGDDE